MADFNTGERRFEIGAAELIVWLQTRVDVPPSAMQIIEKWPLGIGLKTRLGDGPLYRVATLARSPRKFEEIKRELLEAGCQEPFEG